MAVRCADLNNDHFNLTKFDLRSKGDSPCTGMLTHLIDVKYSKIEYPLVEGLPLTDALPFSRREFHMHNEFHWPNLETRGMMDDSERASGH